MSFRAMPAPVIVPANAADVNWPTANKFLNGPFTPWAEQSEAYDLEVISGQIPADLNGALFRIASNPRFRPHDVDRYHWWEGDGGVAAIYLRDGRAAFRMRWACPTTMLRFDLLARGLPGIVWDEAALPHGSQIILMNRDTHEVTWHEIGGMFAPTHYYNAYEDGQEVVVDTHRIDRLGDPAGQGPLGSHEWFPPAYPWQLRVNTVSGKVSQRTISGLAGEFARINDAYVGLRHRYGYFVTTRGLSGDIMTDGLAKHDYDRDVTVVVDGPDQLTSPSEPTFVPRAGAAAEDDGYLLTLWWNRETGLTELLIHAAAALSRQPVARVRLPARVPFGFHGNWASAAALDRAVAVAREAG